MNTGDPEEEGDHSQFIDKAMDEDEATVLGSEATAAVLATATGTEAGRISHAAKGRFKRPPTWAIAAAAAAVVGLVVGLLVGGGDSAPPQAAAPGSTVAAPSSGVPQVVTALAHIAPLQVVIPAIGVDAPLVSLGLNTDGTLEVPQDFDKAGWFTGGNYPGDPTGPPGVIAGHVDNYLGPAVFYDLKNLVAGDEVSVIRADNSVAVFVVTATAQYPKNAFPAEEVYAPVAESELVLITCTGEFNQNARSYLDNLVVRAVLDVDRSLEESNRRVAEGLLPPAVNQENV